MFSLNQAARRGAETPALDPERRLVDVIRQRALTIACCVLGATVQPAAAQGRFTFEGFLGAALNFGTTLRVTQETHPALSLEAKYATRPFESPPYYAFRFAIHDGLGAWEIQFTHHKQYLENRPPEIQNFEITHGFNVMVIGGRFTGCLSMFA